MIGAAIGKYFLSMRRISCFASKRTTAIIGALFGPEGFGAAMRNGGQRLRETTGAPAGAFDRGLHAKTGAVLDLAICAEAIPHRQTLSQIRQTALAAKEPA